MPVSTISFQRPPAESSLSRPVSASTSLCFPVQSQVSEPDSRSGLLNYRPPCTYRGIMTCVITCVFPQSKAHGRSWKRASGVRITENIQGYQRPPIHLGEVGKINTALQDLET